MQSSEKLNRHIMLACVFICMCLSLCSCTFGGSFSYDNAAGSGEYRELFKVSKADTNEQCSESAALIDLEEYGGQVVIDEPGDYIVKGRLYGTLLIDSEDGNVHIMFENVDISALNGPAVYVRSAGKTIITLAEGTDNILSDSTNYDGYEESRACIFSESDLTINGSGKLSVYSYAADGIRTSETLKLTGGDIYVLAKKNGLRGNDGVLVAPDELKLECESYGIVTVTDAKGRSGNVQINAGQINITTGKQAVKSKGDLYISLPANVNIYSVIPDFEVGGERYIEEGAVS